MSEYNIVYKSKNVLFFLKLLSHRPILYLLIKFSIITPYELKKIFDLFGGEIKYDKSYWSIMSIPVHINRSPIWLTGVCSAKMLMTLPLQVYFRCGYYKAARSLHLTNEV